MDPCPCSPELEVQTTIQESELPSVAVVATWGYRTALPPQCPSPVAPREHHGGEGALSFSCPGAPAPLALQCASHDDWRCCRSMHDFSAKDIDGHMVCLDKYKWLVDLHARYAECGLRILAFPCNQFGRQEPGTNEEIKEFAASYNVKFDMYSKICVNGEDAHPLWKWMKVQPKGRGMLGNAIKWNFTKFLIDKNGCVVKRYGPMEEPLVIEKDLPCYL
ncbi:Hypothetical predicted protein [Marmota monax]|uniref:Glutathione peroxidase n=1 Tax=Marmota monax TaxID=9995 RepID=A0A5E4BIX2_MARMO|nr:Hypothetical predicted protein [Marmota monax]